MDRQHAPAAGESQTVAGAAILALVINVLVVLLLSRPLAAIIRRGRGDLPVVVARDYAGRVALVAVAAMMLVAGLLHRPAVLRDRRAMEDAIVRAQAFIGDRAPAEFRRNLMFVSTFVLEAGHMYRICVPSRGRGRTYCVIVETDLPLASSVSFAGYESNAAFGQGTG